MSRCLARRVLSIAAMAAVLCVAGCVDLPTAPPATSLLGSHTGGEPVVMGPVLPSPTIAAQTPTAPPAEAISEPAPTDTPAPIAGPLELTLLHTSDTWGYVLPCG